MIDIEIKKMERLSVGDIVEFTNDYGIKFSPFKILGFRNRFKEEDPEFAKELVVYLDRYANWCPVRINQLKIINKSKI